MCRSLIAYSVEFALLLQWVGEVTDLDNCFVTISSYSDARSDPFPWCTQYLLHCNEIVRRNMNVEQGVTKRYRLSWLSNSALVRVYEHKSRGGGGGCGGFSANEYPYRCAHGAQINFGELTPYLTYDVETAHWLIVTVTSLGGSPTA